MGAKKKDSFSLQVKDDQEGRNQWQTPWLVVSGCRAHPDCAANSDTVTLDRDIYILQVLFAYYIPNIVSLGIR